MLKGYQMNGCITAPGLAIGSGGKTTFKYGNTFAVRANGYISDDVTTADAPALTAAEASDGTTPTTLAIDYQRIYTLLANVNKSTGAVTFTLAVGSDFAETVVPTMAHVNFGNGADDDSHKAVVGFVLITNTTNAFTPGTTALDAAGVTCRYFDNIVSLLGM
jgi:hypothetical protein